MEENKKLTFREKAVGLTFNHAEGEIHDHVHEAKRICAEGIDMMKRIMDRSNKEEENDYPLGYSRERGALSMIAIRKIQDAQMAMVKAITWQD